MFTKSLNAWFPLFALKMLYLIKRNLWIKWIIPNPLDLAEIFKPLSKTFFFWKNSDFYLIRNTKTFQVWTTTPSQKDQVLLLKWRNCKNNSMLHLKKIPQPMREEGFLRGWVIKLRKLDILLHLFSHWLVNKIRGFLERLSD